MSSATLTRHPLEERGAAYTELVSLMKRRQASLHGQEREVLCEAADAMLFDEANREELKQQAEELLETLVGADRWPEESAQQARELLSQIGS